MVRNTSLAGPSKPYFKPASTSKSLGVPRHGTASAGKKTSKPNSPAPFRMEIGEACDGGGNVIKSVPASSFKPKRPAAPKATPIKPKEEVSSFLDDIWDIKEKTAKEAVAAVAKQEAEKKVEVKKEEVAIERRVDEVEQVPEPFRQPRSPSPEPMVRKVSNN